MEGYYFKDGKFHSETQVPWEVGVTSCVTFASGLAPVLCDQSVTSAGPQVPARVSNFTLMTVEEKQMHLSALFRGGSLKSEWKPYMLLIRRNTHDLFSQQFGKKEKHCNDTAFPWHPALYSLWASSSADLKKSCPLHPEKEQIFVHLSLKVFHPASLQHKEETSASGVWSPLRFFDVLQFQANLIFLKCSD